MTTKVKNEAMLNIPPVALLMPVYNGAAYLQEAMQAILAQTFTNFTCIVVDDGSTDDTPRLLANFAAQDARIHILRNETNMGIAYALNRGISEAKCDLIARADADDVMHKDRLLRQYAFMLKNSDVAVCGSMVEEYDSGYVWYLPTDDDTIRVHMLFNSPLAHPTVIFRKKAVISVGGYDPRMVPAEDYDLWERLSHRKEIRFASLPDVLLRYRVPSNDKVAYRKRQTQQADKVRLRLLRRLGLDPSPFQLRSHALWAGTVKLRTLEDWQAANAWQAQIIEANACQLVYNRQSLVHEMLRLRQTRAFGKQWLKHLYITYAPPWLRRIWQTSKSVVKKIFYYFSIDI